MLNILDNTSIKNNIQNVIPNNLKDIFIKDIVNILAVGTGKTHSCGRLIVDKIFKNDNEVLILSTMSNSLIDGIIKEICKCIRLYTNFTNLNLLSEIEKFKGNTSSLLKELNISILNTNNKLSIDDIKTSKVIITNHAYFFPHGHDNNYNNNCYKIQKILKEENKKILLIFDEFDQFHKMGLEVVPINFFIGRNFVDPSKNQKYISDHAFRFCHKNFIEKSHKEVSKDDFDNDFYYKIPIESFNKKLENSKDGIKYFSNSIDGKYDFKSLILDNLKETTKPILSYCNKYGKKIGSYLFKRYDEIIRCKLNENIIEQNIFFKECICSKFLSINESIILITQKIEINDIKSGETLRLNTREEVIEFAKENLTKIEWINYYKTFSSEGKNLYITRMILRKKQFNFNSSNYYLTATPGILEKLGYNLIKDRQFDTPCKIKNIDLFIIQNKMKSLSDMELFFKEIKKNENLETLAISNKKEIVTKFITKNKLNNEFNNVNPVIEDVPVDVGRDPSQIKRDKKNITYIYQKGNQTQGTNYSDHVLLLQDCHIKIDIVERIIPVSSINNQDIIITKYVDAMIKEITQSSGRILRGNLNYKAICLFINQDEEGELIEALSSYLNKYNIKTNLFYTNEVKKIKDRKVIAESIIKHINDRNDYFNLNKNNDMYTFDNLNLIKKDKRKKYDEMEIISEYCKLKRQFSKEKNIYLALKKTFGISERFLKNVKSKNLDRIDRILARSSSE